MYCVLGEDTAHTVLISAFIKSECGASARVKPVDYEGGGNLFNKAAKDIRLYRQLKYQWFVLCHDADSHDATLTTSKLNQKVLDPSGVSHQCCLLEPVLKFTF